MTIDKHALETCAGKANHPPVGYKMFVKLNIFQELKALEMGYLVQDYLNDKT